MSCSKSPQKNEQKITFDVDLYKKLKDYFCNAIRTTNILGEVSNLHMAAWDQLGLKDSATIELAELHFSVVDSPKTGDVHPIPEYFRQCVILNYPEFMKPRFAKGNKEKRKEKDKGKENDQRKRKIMFRPSTSILQQLCDQAKGEQGRFQNMDSIDLKLDNDLVVPEEADLRDMACNEYKAYNKAISNISGVDVEGRNSTIKKIQHQFRIKFLTKFQNDVDEESKKYKLASHYYMAAYILSASASKKPAITFPWRVCGDYLCMLKARAANLEFGRLPYVINPQIRSTLWNTPEDIKEEVK